MSLYKCKLPLLDPLLKIYAVVQSDTWPSWGFTSDLKFPHERDQIPIFDPHLEQIAEVDKESLPIEYQYKGIIGLELKNINLSDGSGKEYPAIELLVGERKLIFLTDDLKKIA